MERTDTERSYNRRHYENNKQQYYERNRRTTAAKREFLREQKAKPCTDCGVEYPYYVMQFDHVRGKKEFGLAQAATLNRGWDAIQEEVAKCDVVCANCHCERTHSRR